jgi:protein-tyrosine phosphatase
MYKFINNRFGSIKGLLNSFKFGIFQLAGKYDFATHLDFNLINRFVFVCSGNICRSPLGEIVIRELGGNSISFGIVTRGGDNADPRVVAFGKNKGLDLSKHITQRVDQYTPQSGDLLIGMEPSHLAKIKILFPNNQVTALGLWLPFKRAYLHDPYSANIEYFNRCAEKIVLASRIIYIKASGIKHQNT